jgi:cbb3-type cytochrome oxidase maturation protein
MSAIIILLIASLSVAALFLGAFIWSVKHHQFDDGYSPSRRMLFDDRPIENISDQSNKKNSVHGN